MESSLKIADCSSTWFSNLRTYNIYTGLNQLLLLIYPKNIFQMEIWLIFAVLTHILDDLSKEMFKFHGKSISSLVTSRRS